MSSPIATGHVRLPAGVRDFLPAAAARRRGIVEAALSAFESWGYQRIITPAFEFDAVLSRGLGPGTGAVRFVDPGTGEIAALRPDFTPQIARLVATRLPEVGGPIRLCYEGSVTRVADGGAGARRELIQAGVELIDAPAPGGDVEVLTLAAEALAAVGLGDATLDVSEVSLLSEALAPLEGPIREEARALVAKKDRAGLTRLSRGLRLSASARRLLEALPALHGGPEVIARAARLPVSTRVRDGLDMLTRTLEEVRLQMPDLRLGVDLGEVRGLDYYTGIRFAGFASGAGDAVLVGGRYDRLVERYGRCARATGFALDVEAVAGALQARGDDALPPRPVTLVVGTPAREQLVTHVSQVLRAVGRPAACEVGRRSEELVRRYAEQAGLAPIVVIEARGARVLPQRGRDAALDAWLPPYLDARIKVLATAARARVRAQRKVA